MAVLEKPRIANSLKCSMIRHINAYQSVSPTNGSAWALVGEWDIVSGPSYITYTGGVSSLLSLAGSLSRAALCREEFFLRRTDLGRSTFVMLFPRLFVSFFG